MGGAYFLYIFSFIFCGARGNHTLTLVTSLPFLFILGPAIGEVYAAQEGSNHPSTLKRLRQFSTKAWVRSNLKITTGNSTKPFVVSTVAMLWSWHFPQECTMSVEEVSQVFTQQFSFTSTMDQTTPLGRNTL